MSNSGLFETRKHEDCNGMIQRLTYSITGLGELIRNAVDHIKVEMRKFDPGPREEPDYEKKLREHEGQMDDLVDKIRQIASEQERGFRMGDYHEGGDHKSWKDWILGLVGLLIVAWLGRLSYQLDSLQALVAKQAVTDQRLDRLENRVYRGSP